MSLDVYLKIKNRNYRQIYVCEEGQHEELTLNEWNNKFPDKELIFENYDEDREESIVVFEENITHNLGKMASKAGIYEHLWRPDEINIKKANQLIEPLAEGLQLLEKKPERFEKFNPANGWGSYDGFVKFVRDYRNACKEYPDADVEISR